MQLRVNPRILLTMRGRLFHVQAAVPRPVTSLEGALWQEFGAIHGDAEWQNSATQDRSIDGYYGAAFAKNQAALCLSGGGIRSAAFSLGVIQGLARAQLLDKFHYISMVSGGGYIGGWLQSMLKEHQHDVGKVQNLLASDQAPAELHRLRGFTNFLTPSPGLLSPDTWTGVLLWIRNVLANWLIFLPALFALAITPLLYRNILEIFDRRWTNFILLAALLCLFVGVHQAARYLPSSSRAGVAQSDTAASDLPKDILWGIVLPLLVWSFLVPVAAAPWMQRFAPADALPGDVIPILAFVVAEAGYATAGFRETGEQRRLFWKNFGWWTLASFVGSLVLWIEISVGIGIPTSYIAVFGPLAVTLAHLSQSLIFVALRKESFRGDLDREWLARLNAEKVVPALLWAFFAAVCVLLPDLVPQRMQAVLAEASAIIATISGPGAAYLGKISKNAVTENSAGQSAGSMIPINLVVAAAALIFAVALFALLGFAASALVGSERVAGFALLIAAGLLAWGLGRRVNINRFSMHAVYRARLVRAFLGSARPARHPDRFTGIDPHDNSRMADLWPEQGARALFPVVNTTLNLTQVRNNAWTERKGESFTITPMACGAAYLHRREDADAGIGPRGAYVQTAAYAGHERETGQDDPQRGITLGTAMTISGAAASPNMGYSSSAGAAFLMTLFNVRLGAWLPNPAVASTRELDYAKPANAVLMLGRELLGRANDQSRAVYLSDGGHFDNLGLYEMVRRRCRHIFVIDADADPDAGFCELGNAVRKIRIDMDIDIAFDPAVAIGSREHPLTPFHCAAYGIIKYPESDVPGELIYLKPADLPSMPMDVRAYSNAHSDFPHQSTLEQFFEESQFESYRQLGVSETATLSTGVRTMDEFYRGVRSQLLHSKAVSTHPAPPGHGGEETEHDHRRDLSAA